MNFSFVLLGSNIFLYLLLCILFHSYEEPCFVGTHLRMILAVGIAQVLLFALGLPLLVYIFLFRHRHELDKPVVKFRYGLFFSGFRKERYYWEIIVALRKESTVLLAVFGPNMGVAMLAHVALLVFAIQLLIQFHRRLNSFLPHNSFQNLIF